MMGANIIWWTLPSWYSSTFAPWHGLPLHLVRYGPCAPNYERQLRG